MLGHSKGSVEGLAQCDRAKGFEKAFHGTLCKELPPQGTTVICNVAVWRSRSSVRHADLRKHLSSATLYLTESRDIRAAR
jgi:hypothetical protein